MAKSLVATLMTLAALRSEPISSDQWALRFLQADTAWQISSGSGVSVAVIDSGVSLDPSLGIRTLPGADFSNGADVSTGDGRVDIQPNGHGTGMATLIAGSNAACETRCTVGLAPKSKIIPIRAYSTIAASAPRELPRSLDYAVERNAQVINLSLGAPSDDPAIRDAVRRALAKDAVIVAAVGNGGDSRQYYPAAYPGVLGVGAIDRSGQVWSQSNTGADVGLVAPGVDIYRDDNQGRQGYSDGTSEATAYVSAAAALVRSAHPTWTAPQVVAALIATADKPAAMHGAVRTDQYGYGILDVLAALRLSEPPPVGGMGVTRSGEVCAGYGDCFAKPFRRRVRARVWAGRRCRGGPRRARWGGSGEAAGGGTAAGLSQGCGDALLALNI